jgi:hypothetical protein
MSWQTYWQAEAHWADFEASVAKSPREREDWQRKAAEARRNMHGGVEPPDFKKKAAGDK